MLPSQVPALKMVVVDFPGSFSLFELPCLSGAGCVWAYGTSLVYHRIRRTSAVCQRCKFLANLQSVALKRDWVCLYCLPSVGDTNGHLSLVVYSWKIKFLIQRWLCWGIRMKVRQWLGLGLEGGAGAGVRAGGRAGRNRWLETSPCFWKAHSPGLGKVPSHNHVIH